MITINKNKKLDQWSCKKEDNQRQRNLSKKLEEGFESSFLAVMNTINGNKQVS